VTFEAGSRLSSMGQGAFADCVSLESICVPSSVETMSRSCFKGCERLSTVTFEMPSRVSVLEEATFERRCSLRSVFIPSSIEKIAENCFKKCLKRSHLTFEEGSKLVTLAMFHGGSIEEALMLFQLTPVSRPASEVTTIEDR
jgi:hypothetical protein